MDPISLEDKNNNLEREKQFKQSVTSFLQTMTLNLPEPSTEYIRSNEEILECNKVKTEREEGRKIKERQRNISKYKKTENKVEVEEFVGKKEVKDKKEDKKYKVGRFKKTNVSKKKRLGKSRRAELRNKRSNK